MIEPRRDIDYAIPRVWYDDFLDLSIDRAEDNCLSGALYPTSRDGVNSNEAIQSDTRCVPGPHTTRLFFFFYW